MLVIGLSRTQIIEYVTNATKKRKGWEVCVGQIDKYIAEASRRFKKLAEKDQEEELGKARRRLNMMFVSAILGQDIKTALAVQKEIHRLNGLIESPDFNAETVNQYNVTFVQFMAQYYDEQRQNRLDALHQRLERDGKGNSRDLPGPGTTKDSERDPKKQTGNG